MTPYYTHPYGTYPGLIERKRGLIDFQVRNIPECRAYRLWAGAVLNNLYGDPDTSGVGGDETGRQMLFEFTSGQVFRSNAIRQRRIMLPESIKGTTRALFDYNDFRATPAAPGDLQPLPPEGSTLFFRLQHVRFTTNTLEITGATNNGDPVLGPILVVPATEVFGSMNPTLTFAGTAPANTGAAFGVTPMSILDPTQQNAPPPMAVVLPRIGEARVHNLDTGDELLVAPGWDQPFVSVKVSGSGEYLEFEGVKELIFAGTGAATVSFQVVAHLF